MSVTSAPNTSAALAVDAAVELEAAVRAYSAAYLGGKGEAYDLLSQRCRERMTRAAFLQLVAAASEQYGPQEIASLKIDQVSGDLGRVTYTYAKPELDQRGEPWVRETGMWRVDDC
ncbi:hypothetical protein [Lentzea tibetensis]|uniref:hypothetical protein n=1 Tax=Lentzea tibetensis TaxID=2591470 RepID=UPI001C993155|nr:hypothetical protein [Lentzea tibetensis]